MTMPHLMNCEHQAEGWCLDCVGKLQAECDALRLKAARYDWLRDRLRVRGQRALSGGVRDGIEFRVGRTFLDVPSLGSFGYLDPAMYYAERDELDAAIDAAMGAIGKEKA